MTDRAKYTPGPWKLETSPRSKRTIISGSGQNAGYIAETRPHWYDPHTTNANARLIASAPDMLAALESVIDQLDGIGVPDWHGAEGLDLGPARAAISAAKGEK